MDGSKNMKSSFLRKTENLVCAALVRFLFKKWFSDSWKEGCIFRPGGLPGLSPAIQRRHKDGCHKSKHRFVSLGDCLATTQISPRQVQIASNRRCNGNGRSKQLLQHREPARRWPAEHGIAFVTCAGSNTLLQKDKMTHHQFENHRGSPPPFFFPRAARSGGFQFSSTSLPSGTNKHAA